VAFALDAALLRHEVVNFHPLVNTATTSMAPAALLTFLKSLGRDPIVLSFNAAGGATRIDAAAPETYLQHNAFEDFP
jgi:Ala-tRNA(Pro) deacylase